MPSLIPGSPCSRRCAPVPRFEWKALAIGGNFESLERMAFVVQKIGIALAAYRPDIKTFALQLESIQNQSWTNWVCVITLDSSLAPLRNEASLKPFFDDGRFVWSENPSRLGHKRNFEHAIQIVAKMEIDALGCSDQDDLWYPDKLKICAEKLQQTGPLSLVHSDMDFAEEQASGELTKTGSESVWAIERRGVENARPEDLLVRNVVAGCSMLMDVKLARQYPSIPDAAKFHDHWYALVASYYGGVHAIHESLFAYRQHASNVVGATPFPGTFAIPKGSSPGSLAEKCKKTFADSRAFAKAAESNGLPITGDQRALFLERRDQGLGLFLKGLRHLPGDRALARACLARFVGKVMGGRSENQSA